MKKILKLAALACAAVLFVSCGAKDDATQIKEAVETYMSASTSFDYGTLKSIVTPESQPVLDQMEQMSKDIPEELKTMAAEAAKNITFNAESIKVDGDVATASISTMGMETPLTFKKVDGKWLLDLASVAAPASSTDEVSVEEQPVEGELSAEEPAEGESDAVTEEAEDGAAE